MPHRQATAVAAAAQLRERLRMPPADSGDEPWGDPAAMSRALEEVRKRHDHPAGESAPVDRIALAVAAFRRKGRVTSFVQLKHVCLGAASGEDCLLSDPELLERLLVLVEHVPGKRRKLKGFQCLLRAYWAFPLYASHVSVASRAGFRRLRNWLARRREEFAEEDSAPPRWFAHLSEHANLLGPHPCERYAPDLLRGDGSLLQAALDGLAIPGDAWVKEEALLAQAKAATQLPDDAWTTVLPQLLDIAAGRAGIAVSPPLARRYIALLVARHARCIAVAFHEGLLDAAIDTIGTPWRRRAAWDANVLDAIGRPCELSREMIGGWLKNTLIEEFFRLHSRTPQRVSQWLRYEPFIVSLWLGQSPQAQAHGDTEQHLRQRARDCLIQVDDLPNGHSLMLLRIGNILAVEFGGTTQPPRFYRWNHLEPGLMKQFGATGKLGLLSLAALARSPRDNTLDRRPGEPDSAWEKRFDEYLRSLVWRGG